MEPKPKTKLSQFYGQHVKPLAEAESEGLACAYDDIIKNASTQAYFKLKNLCNGDKELMVVFLYALLAHKRFQEFRRKDESRWREEYKLNHQRWTRRKKKLKKDLYQSMANMRLFNPEISKPEINRQLLQHPAAKELIEIVMDGPAKPDSGLEPRKTSREFSELITSIFDTSKKYAGLKDTPTCQNIAGLLTDLGIKNFKGTDYTLHSVANRISSQRSK